MDSKKSSGQLAAEDKTDRTARAVVGVVAVTATVGAGGAAMASGGAPALAALGSKTSNGMLQMTAPVALAGQKVLNTAVNAASSLTSRATQGVAAASEKVITALNAVQATSGFTKVVESSHAVVEFYEGFGLEGPPTPTAAGYLGSTMGELLREVRNNE